MTREVMITGGAGFIGARLTEKLLKDGYIVHVLDVIDLDKAMRLQKVRFNKNFYYTKGDLRDKEQMKKWYII